jgi:hypothetical protein
MQRKQIYWDLVLEDVEELAEHIALAKDRFTKQCVSVKAEHFRELERVHSRCKEFQRCVEQMEEADELQTEFDYGSAELAWKRSMDAVDVLLRALPVAI